MKIAEIYQTLQGEGRLTGTKSVFVRASGCNLRCWFCDTPYTSWKPQGTDLSVDEIVERIRSYDCKHVVVTGGEPMIFSELIPLCAALRRFGKHLTIETAGSLYLPLACDLMSISPKFASSAPSAADEPRWHRRHLQERHKPDVIRNLIREHDYQIKFVIDSRDDCQVVEEYLQELPEIERTRVLLMPQGFVQAELEQTQKWLEPYCLSHALTYCPRKQIEWFGVTKKT